MTRDRNARQLEITALLHRWGDGDPDAFDQLVPIVYERLRRLASGHLRNEAQQNTLDTTALVHEAYLKLARSQPDLRDRAHFLALASRVMRHLLVDRARARSAGKRSGGQALTELDVAVLVCPIDPDRAEELDDALHRLERFDPRQSRILELRYFGGLSLEETAEAMDLSLATVKRELRCARAWLAVELGRDDAA